MPHAHARGFPSPRSDRGGQAPALRKKTGPFTVGRGPVPRQATIGQARDRGGQAPALRKKTGPFTVGRGPVPRQATIGETALVGARFSRRSGDRGGQAPALRATAGVLRHAPFGIRRSRTTVTGHAGARGGNPLACAYGRRGAPRYGPRREFAFGRAKIARQLRT